jgi:hypothetical protein
MTSVHLYLRWLPLPIELLHHITKHLDRVSRPMLALACGFKITLGPAFVKHAAMCGYMSIIQKYGHAHPYYVRYGAAKGSQMAIMRWTLHNHPPSEYDIHELMGHVSQWSNHAMWSDMMWGYRGCTPFMWIMRRVQNGTDFELGKTFPVYLCHKRIVALYTCAGPLMQRVYDWTRQYVGQDVTWPAVRQCDNVDLYRYACRQERASPPIDWGPRIHAWIHRV